MVDIDVESVATILGSDFSQKVAHDMMVFGVAWFLFKKTIMRTLGELTKHLGQIGFGMQTINENLARTNSELEAVKESFIRLEKTHDRRLVALECRVFQQANFEASSLKLPK